MSELEGTEAFGDAGEEPLRGAEPPSTSAGETGTAALDAARDAGLPEVVIGEIPDPDDLTHLLWTARCTTPAHGLLGTFDEKEAAEAAKRSHLLVEHGERELP